MEFYKEYCDFCGKIIYKRDDDNCSGEIYVVSFNPDGGDTDRQWRQFGLCKECYDNLFDKCKIKYDSVKEVIKEHI